MKMRDDGVEGVGEAIDEEGQGRPGGLIQCAAEGGAEELRAVTGGVDVGRAVGRWSRSITWIVAAKRARLAKTKHDPSMAPPDRAGGE